MVFRFSPATVLLFALWFPIFWRAAMPYHNVPKMTALHLAAFNGHEQQVSSILAASKVNIDIADETGTYPIIWASMNGHDTVVQMLVHQGANVNARSGGRRNALRAACFRGHSKIAQMLLDYGADINAQSRSHETALYAACYMGHGKIAQILVDYGADVKAPASNGKNILLATLCQSPLSWATQKGQTVVKILLATGQVDPDSKDKGGRSPLWWATQNGDEAIVKTLLATGQVDLDSKDKDS
ncbi:hypothetical protein N7463_009989 [Penicillium fimorum]|uniref:Uncharacterized protein n=1 Tax=Penicillium fimorum TaxID=1882269 RepID=A0A9W9XJ18_9EURO|nr:hypothetical protein N7463_009989 [Penicillium fimorum]